MNFEVKYKRKQHRKMNENEEKYCLEGKNEKCKYRKDATVDMYQWENSQQINHTS